MNNYHKSSLVFILLLLISILVSGCGATAQQTANPGSESLPAGPPAGPGNPSGDDGSLLLSDPTTGLVSLTGYHATLNLQFEGTSGGAPAAWSRSYELRVARGSEVQSQLEMLYRPINPAGSGTTRMIADMGGYQYEKVNQEACVATSSQQTTALLELWELASFLPTMNGAALVGEETIENMLAHHYQFDELALGQSGLTESTGEVWVAADSGIVLRFMLVQKGTESYFGDGTQGTLSWSYQLSEVNQPQQLVLADDCQPPIALDLPFPADARNISQQEASLSFITSLLESELADFYRLNLETQGWQPSGSASSIPFGMSEFDLDGLGLSDFDFDSLNWDDFDDNEYGSEEDDYAAEDWSDFSDLAQNEDQQGGSTEGIYRFERGSERLALLALPEVDGLSVLIFFYRGEETSE